MKVKEVKISRGLVAAVLGIPVTMEVGITRGSILYNEASLISLQRFARKCDSWIKANGFQTELVEEWDDFISVSITHDKDPKFKEVVNCGIGFEFDRRVPVEIGSVIKVGEMVLTYLKAKEEKAEETEVEEVKAEEATIDSGLVAAVLGITVATKVNVTHRFIMYNGGSSMNLHEFVFNCKEWIKANGFNIEILDRSSGNLGYSLVYGENFDRVKNCDCPNTDGNIPPEVGSTIAAGMFVLEALKAKVNTNEIVVDKDMASVITGMPITEAKIVEGHFRYNSTGLMPTKRFMYRCTEWIKTNGIDIGMIFRSDSSLDFSLISNENPTWVENIEYDPDTEGNLPLEYGSTYKAAVSVWTRLKKEEAEAEAEGAWDEYLKWANGY